MRHLLVVTNDFGPRAGGIESFVYALLERLPRGSFTVYTSSQVGSGEFDRKFTEQTGARVVRDRARVLLPTTRVSRRAAALVAEVQADTVWFGAAAPLALMAPRLRAAGAEHLVATTHGHEVWWAKVPVMRTAIRRIGATVDVLTYLGEYTRSILASALGDEDLHVLTRLTPGVDLAHFVDRGGDEIRERHSLGSDPVIVCISRLVHRKGQDRLIEALPLVRRELPKARVLIVGKGPRRKHLEKLARDCGVEDAVVFAGAVPYAELPMYYSAGTIFAMPTRSRLAGLEVEGLGMVYLEASACGRAVLAGRSGGSPDAVLDGETGVVVDDDVVQIADATVALLSDEQTRKQMGLRGREWVEQEWGWTEISARFRQILERH